MANAISSNPQGFYMQTLEFLASNGSTNHRRNVQPTMRSPSSADLTSGADMRPLAWHIPPQTQRFRPDESTSGGAASKEPSKAMDASVLGRNRQNHDVARPNEAALPSLPSKPSLRSVSDARLLDMLAVLHSSGQLNITSLSNYLRNQGKAVTEKYLQVAEFLRFAATVFTTTESGAIQLTDESLHQVAELAFNSWMRVSYQLNWNMRSGWPRESQSRDAILRTDTCLAFLCLIHRHPFMLKHFEAMTDEKRKNFFSRSGLKAKIECLQWLDRKGVRLTDSELISLAARTVWGPTPPESLLREIRSTGPVQPAAVTESPGMESSTDPVLCGRKSLRPEAWTQEALPAVKRARHEYPFHPPVPEYQPLPDIEPVQVQLLPTEPDWMEAQSRYLTAVLWQDG